MERKGGYTVDFDGPLKLTGIPFPKASVNWDRDEIVETVTFQGEHLFVLLDALKANRAFCEFHFDEMFAYLKPDDGAITLLELLSCSVSDELEDESDVPDPKCAKDLIQGIIDSVIKSEWE